MGAEPTHPTPDEQPTATVPGTWPDGEPTDVRLAADADDLMRRIIDFGRRRGEMPMYATLRILLACADERIDEDQAMTLMTDVKAGRWREVVAQLDEIDGR